MDTVKNVLSKVGSNRKIIVILGVTALFIIAAIHVYRKYVVPRLNPTYVANKEFIEQDKDGKTADLYFFYTDWCPHCKKAKPEWQAFKDSISGGSVKGYKINFFEIDCEKDKDLADKYKIEGYPTIKLIVGNQIVEYDAKPSKDTLTEFSSCIFTLILPIF